jgi:hypothetical protein
MPTRKYTAKFSAGEPVTRTSRMKTYTHAWALISADGRVIRHGFAGSFTLAASAAATEEKQHAAAKAKWDAGTHQSSDTTDKAFRRMLGEFYAKPANAEIAAVVEV